MKIKNSGKVATETEFDDQGHKGTLHSKSHRIKTIEQLLAHCKVDLETWEVERVVVNKWEVGAKAPDGTILVEPLFQIKAWLKRQEAVRMAREAIESMLEDARKKAPKYAKTKCSKPKGGHLIELAVPDLHLGKLVWAKECGTDYDTKIAQQVFRDAVGTLMSRARGFDVGKILLVAGNDYFNVDGHLNQTTSGTPQDEDGRWQKSFIEGRRLLVDTIDFLRETAPVDVVMVSGNHDQERSFCLGEVLDAQYHKCSNVTVNNAPTLRKYYEWGSTLLAFSHGDKERMDSLPIIMATERPMEWSRTKFREIHLGHFHKKKQIRFVDVDEFNGVRVRFLSSLTSADAWHTSRGYQAQRAAEAFVWCPEDGLVGQFTYSPN